MDYTELDEAEQKRKKEQTIAWRETKRKSTLFMLAASFFEIVETIFIIIILFTLTSLFFFKVLNAENNETVQIIYQIFLIVGVFIGGVILGFIVYKKVIRWVIIKFKLEDVLSEEIIYHYIKGSKDKRTEELKR